ncbi:MAG: CPBP family intramembrane metalloprotease [Candidatus Thorarchaeota archaeon]|nr:CPBP family intramembrane metalloprotease [Candidatus Thorarchaeota archaeon]
MSDDRRARVTRVTLFALLMVAIVALPVFGSALFAGEDAEVVGSILALCTFPLMYLALVYFLGQERRKGFSSLGLTLTPNTVHSLIIGALSGLVASSVVFLLALTFGGQTRPVSEITADLIISEIVITALVAGLEELSYRGYMMTRMAELWGKGRAILLSSAVFSLVHFSWWLPWGTVSAELVLMFSINLFLGGCVLGAAYYLSGSAIWASIGFHYMWNIVAYVMFPVYPTTPVAAPIIFQIEWGVTTVLGFAAGLGLMYLLFRTIDSSGLRRIRN